MAPVFLRLPPHRLARRVLVLEPVRRAAGAVGRGLALRYDAFEPEQATNRAYCEAEGSLNPRPQARDCSRTQAPTAESSLAPKNFFATAPSTERLPPFWGRNHFWTGFWERGHEQFSESNSPPYRGVASAARSSKLVRDSPNRASPDPRCRRRAPIQPNLARSR
jgi:hypothetical protein